MNCSNCGKPSTLSNDEMWRCQRKSTACKKRKVKCNFKRSLFSGTWFQKSKLSIEKVTMFTTMWLIIQQSPQNFIMRELSITAHTYVDWASFCREVCIHWSENISEKLGGPGQIVELDEAKFGKDVKDSTGTIIKWGQWVFGGVERGTGKTFFVPVKKRDKATLLPIIQEWVLPGTIVMTDKWKGYSNLHSCGYEHLTVNHEKEYVDKETGAHTNNIERIWREARANIPRYGRLEKHFNGYLATFKFKMYHPQVKTRVHYFMKAIASLYPGT